MRKFLLLIMGILVMLGQLLAQTRTITGRVLDSQGNPLVNASVQIRGSSTGTVTNENGEFSLSVPANARTLVISSVGMDTQEITVTNQTRFDVVLLAADRNLQEVVVVGYGTQQRRAFTGTVSRISGEEFNNLIMPSFDKQLAGRATGVQVINAGGSVNTPARIRVRGNNSISQNQTPLIVVDGVPFQTGNLAATTNSNALGDINPSDIETIEVMKDGASTAIYGSRAAGGVIMITTKKGTTARTRVNYDGFVGFSSVANRFSLLNANEFVTIANEKLANAGLAPRAGVNPGGVETDWQDEVFVNNAVNHNHTVSIQGGANKTMYYLSLNYSDNKGVVFTNYNKAYRVRLNLDYEINRFVKIGNNVSLSRQDDGDQNNGANSLGSSVSSTIRLLPNVSPYDTTATGFNIAFPQSGWNAGPNSQGVDDNWQNVAFTLRNNKQNSDKYRIYNVGYLELSPFTGFKVRSQFSVDWLSDYSLQRWDPRHGDGFGSQGFMYNASQRYLRTVWQNYINYNKSFDRHTLFLTAGHEVQKDQAKAHTTSGTQISDLFFLGENYITGSAATQSIGGSIVDGGFESLFGRFNYDFDNKYFAQFTIRRDGQSSLAPEKRYGTFPGVSVGWRLSRENFWTGFFENINEFKLKASYAVVGNALTGFPYLSTFGVANYGNVGGVAAFRVGNPELQWETSKKFDIGIDASFLNNRFTLSTGYFQNELDQLVLDVPTPMSVGLPVPTGQVPTIINGSISQNIGKARNDGFEFALAGDVLRRNDFTWNVSFNYTKMNNKILSLYSIGNTPVTEISNSNYTLIRVNDPMNIIYGYRYAGVNTANGNPMYLTGDNQMVQHNIPTNTYHITSDKNDPTLGAVRPLSNADKVKLGNTQPTYFGAIINEFAFKGFSLEIMLRYAGGNKVYNWTAQEAFYSQAFHNNTKDILNRWTTPGQITDVPKLYFGQGNNINQTGNAISRFTEDGDFLKLQNIVLSYSLNSRMLENATKGAIRNMRVYLQGQNLYTWAKYTGADPENYSTLGLDQGVSPQVRTISGGLSIGF